MSKIKMSFLILCATLYLLSTCSGAESLSPVDSIAGETRACSGNIGTVQDLLIEITDTDFVVTYKPPAGFENCNLDYEVVYWNGVNLAVYQKTVDKKLRQSFNYWEGRVLCKLVNLDVTPILNGNRGETINTNQFTDKFDRHIDIGPARNVTLKITENNLLHIRWISPIDYDSCPILFNVKVIDINGEILDQDVYQGFEWKYDYESHNNYCRHVIAIVQSMMRGITGDEATGIIRLGPPPSGSC